MKVYKLATVKERREHLKRLKLCICCGLSFHGIPWKSGGRNTPCSRDSNLDPVKCQGEACKKGAATCLVHTDKANATKKLKTCNERWGGLGCVKIYKLATVNERREHLKKLKLCFCCGLLFHGIPWKSGGRNTPCNWDRKLDPVKCHGDSCEKGAATCLEHAEEANATEELKAWLDKTMFRQI